MSRVGKKPVIVPSGVDVVIDGLSMSVKGPKGQLSRTFNPAVSIQMNDGENGKEISVLVENETNKNERSQWGTARSLISNMITGVTEGFEKKLEVNGVGYRVKMAGNNVVLNVGYSHEVNFPLPDEITGTVEGNLITISGADKQMVGELAANIRKIRKPEPYKVQAYEFF